MANILESFKEVFSDRFSFFKLAVFAAPIYYCYSVVLKNPRALSDVLWIIYLTIFFLLGFLIKTTGNVLNERDRVLPSLNPFTLAYSAIKGLIAIGPLSAISFGLANYAVSFIKIAPEVDMTMKTIIWLLAGAISLTSFLMFVKNEKISDAYNLKIISEKSPDLMVGVIFFLIQLVIINIPITGFLWYSLNILFGIGPILYAFGAYAIVFNVAVTGHYMAQLQYEILGLDKDDHML